MSAPDQMTADALFDPKPGIWGLRGDPVLWARMQARLADTPMPATAVDLWPLLNAAFAEMTGIAFESAPETISVPGLAGADGGLSNGMVSTRFWHETGLPLLLGRHAEWLEHHG